VSGSPDTDRNSSDSRNKDTCSCSAEHTRPHPSRMRDEKLGMPQNLAAGRFLLRYLHQLAVVAEYLVAECGAVATSLAVRTSTAAQSSLAAAWAGVVADLMRKMIPKRTKRHDPMQIETSSILQTESEKLMIHSRFLIQEAHHLRPWLVAVVVVVAERKNSSHYRNHTELLQ